MTCTECYGVTLALMHTEAVRLGAGMRESACLANGPRVFVGAVRVVDVSSRLAPEALVGNVVCDEAVEEGQRLVLEVQAATVHDQAGAGERVAGQSAVLENERAAGRSIGAEREGDVEDAAAPSTAARATGVAHISVHGRVAQRARNRDEDPTTFKSR